MSLKRILPVPSKSFFLFGPRGTGKSTWLRENLKASLYVDLLKSSVFLDLNANPSKLRDMVVHLKPHSWVIIDEVQKAPTLLDEVHSLYEEKKLNFALSGSSARKLKRGGANLLAGRAIQTFLFPMVLKEYSEVYTLVQAIEWGSLPLIISNQEYIKETLATYVETYLRQEIVEEGLIRKLEPFIRFLQIAGIYNAQILNVENVSREAHVSRTTVDKYFQILEDTMLGYRLPAYQPAAKTREVNHPKFYFFDSGVARACAGLLEEDVDNVWKGFSLETYFLNELRAYNHYEKKNRQIYYYKLSNSYEIDFIIEIKKKTLSVKPEVICIEVKHSKKWDPKWSYAMNDFQKQSKVTVSKKIGIYLGDETLHSKDVDVFPLPIFLEKLYSGQIF